jgi:hypothetical protein
MKTIKLIFGLAVFAAVIYVAWLLIPPFMHNIQFQDWVSDAARQDTYAYNKNEDQIRDEVFREAQADGIPVTEDQIQVSKTGGSCNISVVYTVHVNLPVFPQDLHFNVSAGNANIITR